MLRLRAGRSAATAGALLLSSALLVLYACNDQPTEPGAEASADGISAKPGATQKFRLTLNGDGSTASGTLTSSRGGLTCTITYASGRVTTRGTCAKDLKSGFVISVTAIPSPGSTVAWTGCDAPVTDNPLACQVTMTSPKTISAMFSPPPKFFSLSVVGGSNGSGTVSSDPAGIACSISSGAAGDGCNASFASASSVTLTAGAEAGSFIKAWSGGGCDVAGTGTGTANGSCTVPMDQTQSIIVSFETATDEAKAGIWEAPITWGAVGI